jgi:hypothetical protein
MIMAKTCIAMRKRFEEGGIRYTQDCLTGQIVKKEVVPRQMPVTKVETTYPVKQPIVEIPQFFLAWQERRDRRG